MAGRKRVLIVEDNDINREMLADILDVNYRVLQAENGQVALDILAEQKNHISLILLDVQMPVMDGYTFLDRIKADKEYSMIPVIVMTQSNSEEDELAALDHGATDFLPKPYRPQIILHRVASMIKLRETAAIANLLQYDRLTGLYTKDYFYQKVREYMAEDSEETYFIVGSNFVNFKLVNDASGTMMGDYLLKEFSRFVKARLGDFAFCCRYSADRFLFFFKQEKDQLVWQKFVDFDLQETVPDFKNIVVRWGIYEIKDRTIPVEMMCDRAFLAADRIKHQYNQSWSVYDESLRDELLREQAIISAMDTALSEKQFDVYLQPKFSLSRNCMAGAEALVRWIHPEWGFMSPGEFIPLFEKNGFIPKLDRYVWEWVCAKLSEWKQKGYPIVPVSVNISRADVFHGDLVDTITSLTKKYDIDPAYLHLEITESAYTSNTNQIIQAIDHLHSLGYVIEMDDFGSGYSSFNMLSQMSTDVLKLDMKFIQNELAKPAEQSFLQDVINMAHRAKLTVVAEGVETLEQAERLMLAGCDYAQGYYYAKPLPLAEFERMLTK